mgnify:CR=1 FL=1
MTTVDMTKLSYAYDASGKSKFAIRSSKGIVLRFKYAVTEYGVK